MKTYDESLNVLRRALDSAKLGNSDRVEGFRRLDQFVRRIEEKFAPAANFPEIIVHERAISPSLDGRSVFDEPKKPGKRPAKEQLRLF